LCNKLASTLESRLDEQLIAAGLKGLFERRGQFVVLGLTGRTGSGCTTAAELLTKSFEDLRLEPIASPLASVEQRKHRVIVEFSEKNWIPFLEVSVTLVIVTFMLDADVDQLNAFLKQYVRDKDMSTLLGEIKKTASEWQKVKGVVVPGRKKVHSEAEAYLEFVAKDLRNLLGVLKKALATNYSTVFQAFGDNLRSSGNVLDSKFEPKEFFTLPIRVGEIVVALRELQLSRGLPARVVIDALRNPFEIEYYRQRFASFLLLAVTTPDEDRRSRLVGLNLNAKEISKLDDKEYPAENKPLAGISQFVSQNIQACLEKADIFIRNPGAGSERSVADYREITRQLVTFVSLVQHPGLITPTKIERCMQIAYSAKANSGCISRQVGATITDSAYSVKAVGWNDVPAGQISCLYRKAGDLLSSKDEEAFSDYELKDKRFRTHLDGRYKRFSLVAAEGRPSAYCFKSEYNALESPKMRGNQVHTRSLHAEENAFLQLSKYGGAGIEGGILFSTASPCELCSKKAYQLGIGQIFYIDPYPGISQSHILGAGPAHKRPRLELFSGAVGQAFHRLYDPLLPYNDEAEVFLSLPT
jgi:deoxycytidylate deaminase